jgi:glutaredoxin
MPVRLFFKTVRVALTPWVLLHHRLTRPQPMVRSAAAQARVDARARALALYHFPTCPFCLKTRRAITRLALDIELRDAQHDPRHRADLLAGGGKVQTPCLRIANADGSETWLYESNDIIAYLEREFGGAAPA